MFILLRGAEVYAPQPLGRTDVLLAGPRVVGVGPGIAPPRGVPCEEIDASGGTIAPGLVDAHVHVTGGGGEAGFASRVPPIFPSTLAAAGVTTSVGLLGTDTMARDMESLVAATYGLREAGLSAWCWTGGYAVPPRTLTGSVRRDITFVDPVIGAGEIAISDHRSSQPTLDEILRLASDCHVAGLVTGKAGVLHLHVGDGPRGLDLVQRALDTSELPPRVFHPTHVNRQPRLFEEAMQLAARGVTVDVTAFPAADDDPALPAAVAIDRWLSSDLPRDRLTCSSDGAGCIPVFGPDGTVTKMDVGSPSTLLDAIRALCTQGRPLEDVLPFFTSNVARALRLPGKGRVAPGADADLVVLDAAMRVRDVMAAGRWLVRAGAPRALSWLDRPGGSEP